MTGEAQPDVSGAADDEGRREIEWQLSAPDLGLVRKWLSDHGSVHGLTIESRPTHTINDTYLDTEDWRLRRAGFALRLRDVPGRAEATLKDLAPASDCVRIRREFNEPLPSAEFEALAAGSGPVSTPGARGRRCRSHSRPCSAYARSGNALWPSSTGISRPPKSPWTTPSSPRPTAAPGAT